MTASPGDGEHAAREGYYPDPSIPGYVRYWNGAAWVPGTSRPAPPADETGPVFLDETSATEALPERDPEPAWQADPLHQAGFGGPRDHRVSWGNPPEPAPGARPSGISLARTPEARLPAQAATGILSARSPAAQPPPPGSDAGNMSGHPAQDPYGSGSGGAGNMTGHPERASNGPGSGGVGRVPGRSPQGAERTSDALSDPWPRSVPEETPRRAPGPAGTAPASAPTGTAPEPREPRTGRARPSLPGSRTADRAEPWEPRGRGATPRPAAEASPEPSESARHQPEAPRPAASPSAAPRPKGTGTPRAVFERMAERAVRPAGLARRAVARALDSLVLAAVAAAAAWPQVPAATAHLEAKVDAARASGRTTTVWLLDGTIAGHLGLVLGAVLLFGVLYEALPTARWGRTPGKKLLGVRVLATATLRPPTFGAALRRWLVYALLGLPGALWCLVDRPRRQAWHDKAAKTYVAR
ncbi:RDD family protein [Streptomyces sp. NPDC059989]|uniref:RDD family protein n=1 Tax=Streptomyces sp. NPDC059989 TaxID=3347026 RepID=UPI0036A7DD37